MSVDSPRRSARGRRAPRMSADERERAILATAERLFAERPLREVSIEDLARGAGISRSSFYFYFASKEAVLLALLDGLSGEVDAAREEALQRVDQTSPAALCRATIGAVHATFRRRRWVARVAVEMRASSPEAAELWASTMRRWVEDLTVFLAAEQARGAAPDDVPAEHLAVALNLLNERVLQAAYAEEDPAIPEDAVVDALVAIWLGAIYRGAPPAG